MGNVMVWNGRRKPSAGGAVGSSGIYRPSFAVGRSPSEIVRARMAELGIGTRLKSGKLALNKGKKNKAKSGRSAKACHIKGEKISSKEMQELLARPKTIDKKAAERMAKMLKTKGKASKKAKPKSAKKAKPAAKKKKGGKKPVAKKPAKKKSAKKSAKKPASKKTTAKKPAAKKGGKRKGGRKTSHLSMVSTMTKAREELERKLSKQGAQLASLQKKLAANGKRGKRRKNTKANGSRKRSASVAKRSGRRGSNSAKSATTTREITVAKKKKAKGRKRSKAKSRRPSSKKKKGARKSSRRSSPRKAKKPVAANRKRKGGKRKGGRRNGGRMKMNSIWRALGIGSNKSEAALESKLRDLFRERGIQARTAAEQRAIDKQVQKALRKLASVVESEYVPTAAAPGVRTQDVDAALLNLIGLGAAPKRKKPKRKPHQLTRREAQTAAAKAAKSGKAVKANKKRGKKRKASKAKRHNGKKKGSLSGALAKAEKRLLSVISSHDSKLARLLKSKGKKKSSKKSGKKGKSSKKSSSQAVAKRAAKSGKKGKAKKSNGKRRGKKRRNGAWASGGVSVTDFARNGIREIVTDNFADPVRGILVSVPGAVIGAAAAHMFPRLVASEFFAKNALTRTLGAAIGGLLGVGVTSLVAGRLLGADQGVIQGGAAALGASVRTVSQLVTSLTDPTSKLRMLVGTDASSLADAVNMSDNMIPPAGRNRLLPDGGVMIHDETQDALYEGAPPYGSGNYPDEMADFAMPGPGDIVGDTAGEMSDFAAPEMADFAMPSPGDIVGDTTGEMADFAAPEMADFAAPV